MTRKTHTKCLRLTAGLIFQTDAMLTSHAGHLWLAMPQGVAAAGLLLLWARDQFPNQFRLNPPPTPDRDGSDADRQ